jgi:putative ABC transport system ATP-binding protein
MIDLSAVRVIFGKGTPMQTVALRGIDLSVPKGQFLAVIGSNGAGKSTMLNVIAGVAPVESGVVAVDGTDITRWPVHQRARLISRVFQDPKTGTCESLSIIENFALAKARTSGRSLKLAVNTSLRKEAAQRLGELGLGLEKRLDDRVGLLSGGQRQAVSLVMATTGPTNVLLLDEHTAALDPKTADFVLDLTRKVVARESLTAVMVTHSMAQALQVGDRTVMFHQGRIVLDVDGERRARMTIEDLLHEFRATQHEELTDDALLL